MSVPRNGRAQWGRLFWDADPSERFPRWEIGRILTSWTLAEARGAVRRFRGPTVVAALRGHRSVPDPVRAVWPEYGLLPAREVSALHMEVLPPGGPAPLERPAPLAAGRESYGAGPAAALRLGYRRSTDLDLFTEDACGPAGLSADLAAAGAAADQIPGARHTWHGLVDGMRAWFIRPSGSALEGAGEVRRVPVAATETLAAWKLHAVAGRGERQDWIDGYAPCGAVAGGSSVADRMRIVRQRLPAANDAHILRSLTHFAAAEKAPLAARLGAVPWEEAQPVFDRGGRDDLAS